MASTIECEKFIGINIKVKLNDKRILDGVVTVIDPFGNILLSNTWESTADKIAPEKMHRRELGLVSVPRHAFSNILVPRKYCQYMKNTTP
ncbi:uncharacterized protein PRCAT00001602001 [Priceomyces carsonii]|uniref:uncharacterized protein n=1 Tax=Priceomyces carsonii TaxID=28549 RepID=UPI002EDA8779|nr:unnamed protein product [Priceomyces carsonii]